MREVRAEKDDSNNKRRDHPQGRWRGGGVAASVWQFCPHYAGGSCDV